MESWDLVTVQNNVAVVQKPSAVRQSVSISLGGLLRMTAVLAVVLGIGAGALVSIAIQTRSGLVFGPGLAVVGLLFVTGFVLLSLAYLASR